MVRFVIVLLVVIVSAATILAFRFAHAQQNAQPTASRHAGSEDPADPKTAGGNAEGVGHRIGSMPEAAADNVGLGAEHGLTHAGDLDADGLRTLTTRVRNAAQQVLDHLGGEGVTTAAMFANQVTNQASYFKRLAALRILSRKAYITTPSDESALPSRVPGYDYISFLYAGTVNGIAVDVHVPILLANHLDVDAATKAEEEAGRLVKQDYVSRFNQTSIEERRQFLVNQKDAMQKLREYAVQLKAEKITREQYFRELGSAKQYLTPRGIHLDPDTLLMRLER